MQTLGGGPPLIIGHRGLPGLAPEETAHSYELASRAGAESFEADIHLSKDGVLVARHNPWLSDNTNVGSVAGSNPAVSARRRVDPGSFVVDAEDHTGDWAISDFTVAELKQWLGATTYDAADERPTSLNGLLPILTLQEIIDLARRESSRTGRVISVYPETKNPSWNNAQAIAKGVGQTSSRPLEDAFLRIIEENGLNAKDAPIFVQSFEPGSLKYMVAHGLRAKTVQLIAGAGVDLTTGAVIQHASARSQPHDWLLAGDKRRYDSMVTPAGLAEIRTYADGIGPWKPYIIPYACQAPGAAAAMQEALVLPPTSLVEDAHRAGLFVHAYTFRDEARYLTASDSGDPKREYLRFFELGVDGVFTDHAATAFQARAMYLAQSGQAGSKP